MFRPEILQRLRDRATLVSASPNLFSNAPDTLFADAADRIETMRNAGMEAIAIARMCLDAKRASDLRAENAERRAEAYKRLLDDYETVLGPLANIADTLDRDYPERVWDDTDGEHCPEHTARRLICERSLTDLVLTSTEQGL